MAYYDYDHSSYDYPSYDYGTSSPQDQTSLSDYNYYYQAQPLARDGSSGGSSQASYPESPIYDHYYAESSAAGYTDQMQYYTQDQSSSGQYAAEYDQAHQSQPHADSNDGPVCCLHTDCPARPFKRPADLQRHYTSAHAPKKNRPAYHCDYPKCSRATDPFHRRDHFRDHLRDFHCEDIHKRGATINAEWLENRYASSKWWRCPPCLIRVSVSQHGFECPRCKTSCEPSRKEKRRRS